MRQDRMRDFVPERVMQMRNGLLFDARRQHDHFVIVAIPRPRLTRNATIFHRNAMAHQFKRINHLASAPALIFPSSTAF